MFVCNSHRIICVESEADNEFRANDLDLRERKLLSRTNEVAHRYRTADAAPLYKREKIRGVSILQLDAKMLPEQFNQPSICRESPSPTISHAIGIQRTAKGFIRTPILQENKNLRVNISGTLRIRGDKVALISPVVIITDSSVSGPDCHFALLSELKKQVLFVHKR